MKYLMSLLLALSLNVYAAPTLEEVITSPDTFAVCKTVDIATTAYSLGHGMVETNPIMAHWIQAAGWGPIILLMGGIYWALKQEGVPKPFIGGVNVGTCATAAHNLLILP
jgi:hypothetical protein